MSTYVDAIEAYKTEKQPKPSVFWPERQEETTSILSEIQIVLASTDDLIKQSYQLRYQVYCLENNFEPAAAFPNRMETDEYDPQSFHAVLVTKSSNAVLGTVRLIMPTAADSPGNALPLPLGNVCDPSAFEKTFRLTPYSQTAECSRFAISKHLRRDLIRNGAHYNDVASLVEACAFGNLSNFISLKLVQALIEMARAHDISHLCAVMTPSLLRMFRYLGIYFEKIGPTVEYHGRRQPCFFNIEKMLQGAWSDRPDVWEVLTDGGRLAKPPIIRREVAAAE